MHPSREWLMRIMSHLVMMQSISVLQPVGDVLVAAGDSLPNLHSSEVDDNITPLLFGHLCSWQG